MCLSIPAKINNIEGDMATVSVGNITYKASLCMVDDAQVGDYVLLHTGFAIQKINPEEAEETLRIFRDFEQLNEELDREERTEKAPE